MWKVFLFLSFLCPHWVLANAESLQLIQAQSVSLKDRLGIYRDPFLGQVTLDQQMIVWNQMLKAFPLLLEVRHSVFHALRDQAELDVALELKVIQEAQRVIADPKASSLRLAGALTALQKLQQVYDFRNPPKAVPETGPETGKDAVEKPPTPESKPKPKKAKQPADPDWPDLKDDYQASNKDTDKSEGAPQERVTIAWVDQPQVAYFRGAVFQGVNARTGVWNTTEITDPQSCRSGHATNTLVVKPFQKKGIPLRLLVPQGFVPQTFKKDHSAVWQDSRQNYYFQTILEELKIPLIPIGSSLRPLSPAELDVYTSPTGVNPEEWPESLREQIETLQTLRAADLSQKSGRYFGVLGDFQLAQDLGDFIASHFKYKVDQDSSRGALEAVQKGAFQCDIAATTLTSILRDGFRIPSRPVGGFRGMSHRDKPSSSHVTSPAEGHAWVEVADSNGNWWSVDPTPRVKDRKTQDESSDDPYENIVDPHTSEQQQGEEDTSEPTDWQEGNLENSSESASDLPPTLKELTEYWKKAQAERAVQDQKNQAQSKSESKSGQSESTTSHAPDSASLSETEIAPPKANEHLEKLLTKTHPALAQILKRFFLWALDPSLPSPRKLERLNQVKSALGPLAQFQKDVSPTLTEATLIFGHKNPPLLEWLRTILNQASKRPLEKTVDDLVQLQHQVEFMVQLMEPEESVTWIQLLGGLQKLRMELNSVRHPQSSAIRIAQEFIEGLPGKISKQAISEKFALKESLGDDLGTLALAREIGKGHLNEFRLESLLGPHTEFVVDPLHHPSLGTMKTWNRANLRQNGRFDLLTTKDSRDRRRFVRLNPALTDEEALKRREMYVLAQRRRDRIPAGVQDTDPEKATVLLFDTSGSMSGKSAYFQSMYIAALVDRALSDVGAEGRTRHHVYLIGFDSDIQTPIEVTNSKQALELVLHAKARTQNTGGGTDIQKALLGAAELLTQANQNQDRALARATVVLMSDGGSKVDSQVVREAFAQVDRGKRTSLDLLMAFVAIDGSNSELEELVRRKDLGSQKNTYIEWSREDIDRILKDAEAAPTPLNDFWTKSRYDELPTSIRSAFDQLYRPLSLLQSGGGLRSSGSADGVLQGFAQKLGQNHSLEDQRPRTYVPAFRQLRRTLKMMGAHLSIVDRSQLLSHLMSQWHQYFPDAIQLYDVQEVAHLKFILDWAHGIDH